MSCKLWDSSGKLAIIEATIALGKPGMSKLMLIEVVLGERRKRMDGIDPSFTRTNLRVFRFGSMDSLLAPRCRTETRIKKLGVYDPNFFETSYP